MDCSTPGFPVLYHLLELAQTHIHWIGAVIQPSHPLSSPSLPAFNLSQHQRFFLISQFFTSGDQSPGASSSASVLSINNQDWSPLGFTGLIALLSKGLSRVFSNTTVQKHQFFGTQCSLWSSPHIHGDSLVAQTVKCLPAIQETRVWYPGREDPLEKEWQSTPVLLPRKFHGWRSLVGYSPWGHKESDMTERLHFHFHFSHIHIWLLEKP